MQSQWQSKTKTDKFHFWNQVACDCAGGGKKGSSQKKINKEKNKWNEQWRQFHMQSLLPHFDIPYAQGKKIYLQNKISMLCNALYSVVLAEYIGRLAQRGIFFTHIVMTVLLTLLHVESRPIYAMRSSANNNK